MKIFIILFMFIKIDVSISAELDLKRLKELALKNSFSLNAAASNIEASKGQLKFERSKFLPKIGIQAGKEWVRTDGFSDQDNFRAVYGSINLFNGFRDSNQYNRSKLLMSSQKELLENQKLNLELNIEQLYYTYLFLEKKRGVTQTAIQRNKQHLKLVKKRLNSKLITRTDLLEFKLRNSQLLSEKDFIDLELIRIKKRLLNLSGIDNVSSYSLKGSLPHLHLKSDKNTLLGRFLEKNSDVKSLKYKVKDFELSQKINNSGWYPQVNLQARYGRLDENETGVSNNINASQITVMATWELFSGFSTTGSKQVSSAKRTAAEYQLRQKKLDLRLQVSSSLDEIGILEKRIDITESNQKMSKRLYQRTLKEYQKGIKNSGDLVSASDLYKNLSSDIFEMKLKYLSSKIELERTIGSSLGFETIKH